MRKIRIIPRLDVKGPNVVKGIQLEGLRKMDTPDVLAKKYEHQGADELVYMDIVASLYDRSIDFDLVNAVAKELTIPLTVGGGIKSIEDINNILHGGADKIAINTYAVKNPSFIEEAVRYAGAQCIVLSIEAKQVRNMSQQSTSTTTSSGWEVYTEGGREHTGLDVVEWAKKGLEMGVGEIMLTSVDHDGTRKGYDMDLIKAITDFATVPVTVYGGASGSDSMKQAITEGNVDGVCAATILHYDDVTIGEVKADLQKENIPVRIVPASNI